MHDAHVRRYRLWMAVKLSFDFWWYHEQRRLRGFA